MLPQALLKQELVIGRLSPDRGLFSLRVGASRVLVKGLG